jgi:hypothetical protein
MLFKETRKWNSVVADWRLAIERTGRNTGKEDAT